MAGLDDPAAPVGGARRSGPSALPNGQPTAQGDPAADARWEVGNLSTSEVGGGGGPAPASSGVKVVAATDDPMIGQVIADRYRIEARLGEGGMGAVYRVEHMHMRKRLALKVLHREMVGQTEIVARFEREAMAAAHIEHPNVAGATDFGKLEDGSCYLVLEYVEGISLRSIIDKGPLSPARAVHVTSQIFAALRRAHELGIVHRDLKPENVLLVEKDGDPDFVKVLDFGIARVPTLGTVREGEQGTLTRAGMVYGTPEYMSPEQALGQPVDGRADEYAVGVMLFEMLAGKRPYDNKDKVALLGQHVAGAIPNIRERAPSVPESLAVVLTKMLAKSADARYADAQAAIDALAQTQIDPMGRPVSQRDLPVLSDIASAQPVVASVEKVRIEVPDVPAVSPTHLATPRPQRSPTLMLLSVVAVLAALAAVVFVMRKGPDAAGGASTTATSAAAVTSGSAAPSAASSVKTAPSVFADVDLKGQAMAALGRVTAGEVDAGLKELEKLATDHPKDAAVLRTLATAYVKAKKPLDALATAKTLLAVSPESSSDPAFDPIIDDALAAANAVDAAFGLLEGPMHGDGSRVLYDMAYGTRGPANLRLRAQKALNDPEVQRSMPNAIRAALELHNGNGTCAQKKIAIEKWRNDLDQRSLVQLKYFQTKTSGCGGFFRNGDCYGCLRENKLLDTVVKETEARLKSPPAP